MSLRVPLAFDRFYTSEEAAAVCRQLAECPPDFVRLHRIGQSFRGRDLLLLEIADFLVAGAAHRPGFYVDGATHADEVVGVPIALYLAARLAEGGAGEDEHIARLLRRVVFYILPIVNPDGVDVVLNQGLPWIGNGRCLPGEELPEPGLYYADVDGDGFVTQLRMRDPHGEWKSSSIDDRLLTLRAPDAAEPVRSSYRATAFACWTDHRFERSGTWPGARNGGWNGIIGATPGEPHGRQCGGLSRGGKAHTSAFARVVAAPALLARMRCSHRPRVKAGRGG